MRRASERARGSERDAPEPPTARVTVARIGVTNLAAWMRSLDGNAKSGGKRFALKLPPLPPAQLAPGSDDADASASTRTTALSRVRTRQLHGGSTTALPSIAGAGPVPAAAVERIHSAICSHSAVGACTLDAMWRYLVGTRTSRSEFIALAGAEPQLRAEFVKFAAGGESRGMALSELTCMLVLSPISHFFSDFHAARAKAVVLPSFASNSKAAPPLTRAVTDALVDLVLRGEELDFRA
jgi:hypothetical protein